MRGKGKQVRIRRTPSVDVDDQATNGTVSDTVEDLDIPSNAIDEHLGPTIAALICTVSVVHFGGTGRDSLRIVWEARRVSDHVETSQRKHARVRR
jgi:hypothetical protein